MFCAGDLSAGINQHESRVTLERLTVVGGN